ncbi:hypothetical protein [Microcoleus sp. FACHB-672]|uniref:hypothetical protein n=1 Tax=Microcoleus sp. FACHB-672 TaxID=2692825 RepID=UPI001688B4D0|nr:hypothetical protein [Microcoleus sp. FACHB-672]MBD2044000.1 hypothetical protein [Microcoleus sp. FACHB-672]
MAEESKQEYPFELALHKFLIEINGLADSLPIIMEALDEARQKSHSKIEQFLEKNGQFIKKIETKEIKYIRQAEIYGISPRYAYDLKFLTREGSNFNAAFSITPKGFLVTIVSQFDAFMGRLIRAMYYAKPELLNASEKQLTFANLVEFGTLEVAREYVLEKEIESVLRASHSEHFEWLEKKLGISLRKDLSIWSDFIELTERRNLFVHTDGEISSQYINVCRKHSVSLDEDCIVGKKLGVNNEYFQRSCEILFELATKLTHVVWRKLTPSELFIADKRLNNVCYDLLKEEKYDLAKRLLSFALCLPKHNSQQDKLIFTINSAIAYKWGGDPKKAEEIILSTDWSSCNNSFKLTRAVLLDQFDEATNIMRKIGAKGEVDKEHYKDWPVFKDFRQSPQFLEAYTEVFGEVLEPIEISEESDSNDQDEPNFFMADSNN